MRKLNLEIHKVHSNLASMWLGWDLGSGPHQAQDLPYQKCARPESSNTGHSLQKKAALGKTSPLTPSFQWESLFSFWNSTAPWISYMGLDVPCSGLLVQILVEAGTGLSCSNQPVPLCGVFGPLFFHEPQLPWLYGGDGNTHHRGILKNKSRMCGKSFLQCAEPPSIRAFGGGR